MSPSRLARRAVMLIATALGAILLARISALPLPYRASDAAQLRLSWTARPERIEQCRAATAEELAARPEHMRQRIECEGKFASYALRVELDGRTADEAMVRGGGFRHDRPLHLLREVELPPGEHRLHVRLARREEAKADSAPVISTPERADTGLFAGRAGREAAERQRRVHAAIPSLLELDTLLTLSPRQVVLVTFDAERRRLELRTGMPPRP